MMNSVNDREAGAYPAADQPRGGGGSGVSSALVIGRAGPLASWRAISGTGVATDAPRIVDGAMQPTHKLLPIAGALSGCGAGAPCSIGIAISAMSWHAGAAAAGAGTVPSTSASRMSSRKITLPH